MSGFEHDNVMDRTGVGVEAPFNKTAGGPVPKCCIERICIASGREEYITSDRWEYVEDME